jgi:hypothetical protein
MIWNCNTLCALRELLLNEWKGDTIIFIGDESHLWDGLPDCLINKIHNVFQDDTINHWDFIFDRCVNKSGLFMCSEKDVKEEVKIIAAEDVPLFPNAGAV